MTTAAGHSVASGKRPDIFLLQKSEFCSQLSSRPLNFLGIFPPGLTRTFSGNILLVGGWQEKFQKNIQRDICGHLCSHAKPLVGKMSRLQCASEGGHRESFVLDR